MYHSQLVLGESRSGSGIPYNKWVPIGPFDINLQSWRYMDQLDGGTVKKRPFDPHHQSKVAMVHPRRLCTYRMRGSDCWSVSRFRDPFWDLLTHPELAHALSSLINYWFMTYVVALFHVVFHPTIAPPRPSGVNHHSLKYILRIPIGLVDPDGENMSGRLIGHLKQMLRFGRRSSRFPEWFPIPRVPCHKNSPL